MATHNGTQRFVLLATVLATLLFSWLLLTPTTHLGAAAQSASPRFLTLPFTDPAVRIQQGYNYNYAGGAHEGIDYIKGAVDQSWNWQPFEVRAAADGEAVAAWSSSWGNYVYIKHNINNQIYYTLYAHLDHSTLSQGRATPVSRGTIVGVTGLTGRANGVIHLHFEVSRNSYGSGYRLDPYGLYATRDSYPGFRSCPCAGNDYYWTTDPPSYYTNSNSGGTSYNGSACDGGEGVYLYEHTYYMGRCIKLTADAPDARRWSIGNDSASSIRFVGNWYAYLYQNTDFQGRSFAFAQDFPDFNNMSGLNDWVSSIKIRRR